MRRHLVAAFAAGALVSLTTTPWPVRAEPQVLDPFQLETVTAAGLTIKLPEINLNVAVQTAVPIAVATSVCAICRGGSATAVSSAAGTNTNLTSLTSGR